MVASRENSTNACEAQGGAPASKRRRRATTALWVALVAAGVLAAWQVHEAFWRAELPVAARTPSTGDSHRPEVRPVEPTSAPGGEIFAEALGAHGLAPFTNDPGDVPPPAGARRNRARESRSSGKDIIEAVYDCDGDVASVARYYEKAAAAKGFDLVADRTGALGLRQLLFDKSQTQLIISLRKHRKKHKIVRVIVTLVRPSG